MGLLTRYVEQRAHPSTADPALIAMFGGRTSASGIRVTADRALGVSAVLSVTRILAESMASIPLHLYRRMEPRGRARATEHGLYFVLHDKPNPWQTSFEWREMMQGHLVLRGNAYSFIQFNGAGEVVALIPLHPDRVTLRVDKVFPDRDPIMWYEWRPINGAPQVFFPDEVLHLRGLSDDGFRGLSPLDVARDVFGSAIALEEHQSRFFANRAEPGGILSHPKKLSKEAKESLRESWESRHGGSNVNRVAVMEEGLTWTAVGVTNKDSQFLEARKFSVTEFARIYRIPPHMMADLEHATFSNIEHQGIEFTVHTVRPWAVRWEQRLGTSLLSETERRTHYASFNLDGFSRGDQKSRYEAYAQGRNWGWLSANDVRELEDMNPLPDDQGDIYLVPLNTTPADAIANPAPAPAKLGAPKARALLGAGTEERSLVVRDRLRSAFGHVFRETVARAMRAQVSAARRVLDRAIASGEAEHFRAWLEENAPVHADFVTRTLHPVMLGYAEAVQGEAAFEVNGQVGVTAELASLVQLAADGAGQREAGALGLVVGRFLRPGNVDDLRSVVGILADWEERRSSTVAGMESVRLGAEVARFTYRNAGVIAVTWIQRDEEPWCGCLHNRSVMIDEPFLHAGDVLKSSAGEMPISSRVHHPPLTERCSCTIIPKRSEV